MPSLDIGSIKSSTASSNRTRTALRPQPDVTSRCLLLGK